MAKIHQEKLTELLDEIVANYEKPEDILGEEGILKQLSGAIIERVLKEEMTEQLGYPPEAKNSSLSSNSRNGYSAKTLKTKSGDIDIRVPRDRESDFEPKFVKKHQRRFDGFDDKIISMYARGMSTRDIQAHLKDIYGTEISAQLISTVTNGVMEEVKEWQNSPLDRVYPIVYMDAIRIKVRDNGEIKNKAVYLALAVNMEGRKDLLGIWMAHEEGAKFWLSIVTELKNRGVQDILIACVDGLKGFPEAIESIFPDTKVQLCIVHMVRYSLKYVSYKDKKQVATDLKDIYKANTEKEALEYLEVFAKKWDDKYPAISDSWQRNWEGLCPFLDYPKDIRKAIYTTNAIESLNDSIKKITKGRRVFPNDESVMKLIYLGIQNISKKWTMPIRDWSKALNQFAILFAGRLPLDM
ncbi:MAG: IS256 family transposase [Gammaproteobacteria bacterium]|nr:IS256 family transposase [Gammaproteobacteria bacterium]